MMKIKSYKKLLLFFIVMFFVVQYPFSVDAVVKNNHQENFKPSASEIINISNNARQEKNLHQLIENAELIESAKQKMKDMQANHYFDHYSPTQKSLKHFLKEINYDYLYAGENLAKNYNNSSEIVQAWLDSPTHRNNMLHQDFTEVGIYIDYVNIEGVNQLVTVMFFGKKKNS